MNLLFKIAIETPTIFIQIAYEKLFKKQIVNFEALSIFFKDKSGIEIGGPSKFFSINGFIPIYGIAKVVDGCNFSTSTAWEGQIIEGPTYLYSPTLKKGYQFVCEGVEVSHVPKANYDFLLSCNSLEHIANPLKAITNWLQLLRPNGILVLVLPKKESNFDHQRPITTFKHLLADYNNNIGEDDTTHFEEVFKLHDLGYDPLAGSAENFRERTIANFTHRCVHHHIFDQALLAQICDFFNLKIVQQTTRAIDHIIIAQYQG